MDLPKSKISYWKAIFIDGLPPLFVERVKKTLRGDHIEIPYDTFFFQDMCNAIILIFKGGESMSEGTSFIGNMSIPWP